MTTDASLDELADAAEALAELRAAARDVLRRAWSPERLRRILDDDVAFDDELWATIRQLGWCDVLVPAADGGGGATLAELCVLSEEAGAAGAPVPLAVTAAAAVATARCIEGTPLLLPGAATVDGRAVTGRWPVMPYASIATQLVVVGTVGSEDAILTIDPAAEGVSVEPVRPLDHGPAAAVHLEGAPAEILVSGPAAATRGARALRTALLGCVAELVGVAAAANEAACEYAKVRIAFDRPIGTYQAIKHRLVDQRASIEVARALVMRAADAHDREHAEADALASLAAFWAQDNLRRVPEGATQVFGGIAYTWEHDAHVHLRRAAVLSAQLGARAHHRRVVGAWLRRRHLGAAGG